MGESTVFDSESSRAAHAERRSEHEHSSRDVHEPRAQHAGPISPAQEPSEGAEVVDTTYYPGSLLGSRHLTERGNEPVRVALVQQMQQSHGNRAVQRFMHAQRQARERSEDGKEREGASEPLPGLSMPDAAIIPAVQRAPADKKTPPTPEEHWTDAPTGSPNAGPTKQGAKGTILRIPLQGLPGGMQGDAPDSATGESAKGRAIALVPASIANSKEASLSVEVLLHLHGYGVGYRTRTKQLTSNPTGGGHDVKGGEPDTVRDIALDRTAEQLEVSGRPMIGVLPQGAFKSGFGSFKPDQYVQEVFAALKSLKEIPDGVTPGNLVLSGHSGGGDRIIGDILGTKNEPAKMQELVLFDAINREDEKVNEVTPLLNWLTKRVRKDVAAIKALGPQDDPEAWVKSKGFRFRTYFSTSTGYTSRNRSLEKKFWKWFDSDAKVKALDPKAREAMRANYAFIATGVGEHERLMGDSSGFSDALGALPPAAGQPSTAAPAPAGPQQPTQTPAPQPARAPEPALNRMPAPHHRAPVQRAPGSANVPVQRDKHDGHEEGDDEEAEFEKVKVKLSTDEMTLVEGKDPVPAEGKTPAQPGMATIKESPVKSAEAILKKVGLTSSGWFGDFTNASFLGRQIKGAIHTKMAEHLKKVEGDFVAKFAARPENQKKYAGKETEPETIAAAGDDLGLSKDSEDFHGSREKSTSSAKISMHMFGLAVDLNYTANPWVGQTAKNLTLTNQVFARVGMLKDGQTMRFAMGLSFDDLASLDKALEEYFSYLDDADKLKDKLDEVQKRDRKAQGTWRGKTVKQATRIIRADLNSLAGIWERGGAAQKETVRKGGFMDFKKELVEGIDLSWGGQEYGDMMHFDMRNKGTGKQIFDTIQWYKGEKKREAIKKYAEEHKEEAKPAPAQPGPVQRSVSPVQRQEAPGTIEDEEEEKEQDEPLPVQPSRSPGAAINVQRDGPGDAAPTPDLDSAGLAGTLLGGVAGAFAGVASGLEALAGALGGAAGGAGATTADADIEALNLAPEAKAAAIEFRKKHPGIRFTSGRRDVHRQCRAMAENIVVSGDRKWIEKTYAKTAARDKLQGWVDEHPEATTKAQLTTGLEDTMSAMSDRQKGMVSAHLSGYAFDVQPQTEHAEEIKADIKALPGIKKFLEKEGGLVRWHAQFKKASPSEQAGDPLEREADRMADMIAGKSPGYRPIQAMPAVQRQEAPTAEEDEEDDEVTEEAPPVQTKRFGVGPQAGPTQPLPQVQLGPKKKAAPPKKPPQPFFSDAKGTVFTVDSASGADASAPKIPVGHASGGDTYVTVDAKGKLGVPADDALLGDMSIGGRLLRVKKVKVEEAKGDSAAAGETKTPDASGMKGVKVTPVGGAVGIEEMGDGTFGGVVLKSSAKWLQKKNIGWEPVELKDWPSGTQSKLQSAVEPQIDLPSGFAWVLMDYSAKKGQASALHWVPSKHSEREYEQSKESIEKEKEKLPDNLKEEVEKNLSIIASVSTVEGQFGSTSGPGDRAASLGIFQWAQGAGETSAGGSSLGTFFKALKKRHDEAHDVEAAKRTEEQKLYIQAWEQCVAAGLDVDSKGLITIKEGDKSHAAKGSELEDLLSGTSGPMATGALRKYQLVAAMDWIKDVKGTVVRPGGQARGHDLIEKSYSEGSGGLTVTFKLSDEAANYTFELDAPSDHATIADVLSDDKSIATAVSLGVNRPHYVETAMWLALTTGDPKADIEKHLKAIAEALEGEDDKAAEEHPAEGKEKPKAAPKGKKPRKPNVTVTAAQVAKLSKEAQQAHADLLRLVWPAKRTLDDAAEAKLVAKFKGAGIGLYPGGQRHERAMRLATEAVTE